MHDDLKKHNVLGNILWNLTIENKNLASFKLKAPPVDGEANKELIKFLSDKWKIPKSKIKIVKGLTSRTKIIEIDK